MEVVNGVGVESTRISQLEQVCYFVDLPLQVLRILLAPLPLIYESAKY